MANCLQDGLFGDVCRQACCRSLVCCEVLLCAMQNRRGGRVKLLSILLPETEFNHKDKVTSLIR